MDLFLYTQYRVITGNVAAKQLECTIVVQRYFLQPLLFVVQFLGSDNVFLRFKEAVCV